MDGVLVIDKPAGITSAEVVRRIKARVKPARVGHLGTLDPFATGVLPILIGEATKLAAMLDGGEKEYEGVIALGTETDTLDRDGKILREAPLPRLDEKGLAMVAAQFTGSIEQVPPLFSAIKREGVRMYTLARKGGEVAAPPARMVEIKRLSLAQAAPATIAFSVVCSRGTYARSLARDIAAALGSVGHLSALRRIRNGNFALAQAVTLEAACDEIAADGATHLISLREAWSGVAEVAVDEMAEKRLRNGDARALDGMVPGGATMFKVIRAGRLVAVARATSAVTAAIVRVFNPTDAAITA